jgi:hypothetical protein
MITLEEELGAAVADLSHDLRLTVVDLVRSAAIYQVSLDSLGVPRVQQLADTRNGGSPDITADMSFLVCALPDTRLPESLQPLVHDRPQSWIQVAPETDVLKTLRDVIANSPIRQRYELVLGHAVPSRNRILLSSVELFPPGAKRGAVAELMVRSVCTSEGGTVLAVVAREDRDSHTPRLLSADSIRLEPGPQQILAELVHPGEVRFIEPADVTPDRRSLSALMDAVPPLLNTADRTHLICAVDVTGLASRVAARLYRVEMFMMEIRRYFPAAGQLKVGLIAFGAHRAKNRGIDDRIIVTDWASNLDDAAKSLGKLGAAAPDEDRVAQVEDALAEIERRLRAGQEGRLTSVVIFGDGQPYPAQSTETMQACPKGYNWENVLRALKKQECRIAAVRDNPSGRGAGAWRRLGSETVFTLERFETEAVGRHVGLIVPALEHMPFPLAG